MLLVFTFTHPPNKSSKGANCVTRSFTLRYPVILDLPLCMDLLAILMQHYIKMYILASNHQQQHQMFSWFGLNGVLHLPAPRRCTTAMGVPTGSAFRISLFIC